jgi:transcriptional regulator with XRE-family HTH domain
MGQAALAASPPAAVRSDTMTRAFSALRPSHPTTAGTQLRHWREIRGKPQLELALDTGISQKHVSFVETGRSTPSRQMIIDIADALQIPLRQRNAIFVAAGYAPIYRDEPLDAPSMQSIDRAIRRMLRQHDPFPAIVMDRYWNVIETNISAPAFFSRFIDLSLRAKPRNLLHLMFDPEGMRPFLLRWEETARSLLSRVQREAVGHVADERTQMLLAELMAYPGVPQDPRSSLETPVLPMIPLRFRAERYTLNLFSMITTVGTPQTIVAEEMRIETMFPADEETEGFYLDFMSRTDIGGSNDPGCAASDDGFFGHVKTPQS